MKGIRHENKVCRSSQLRNVVSITRNKLTTSTIGVRVSTFMQNQRG
jgi:hypothetical protein